MFEEHSLPDHLREVKASVRRIADAALEPLVAEIDRSDGIPAAVWDVMRRYGFLGMQLPEQYGGANLDVASFILSVEELARCHPVFAALAIYSSGGPTLALLRYGTAEQKERWLRGIANGTIETAFALTEPQGGSDAAAIRTWARKTAKGWSMTGRKHFISEGHRAHITLVMAVTDPEKRARGGISAFLVPKGTPGLSVTRAESTMGTAALKLAELTFEDCEVDDDAVLGPVGDGTFGEPLANRQAIQWMVADSAMELAATRAFVYQTLLAYTSGKEVGAAPSMCKVYAAEMVGRVADRAVQIFGGMGLIRGFPIERIYRDVRHYRIGEGTSEIQRIVIARSLLNINNRGKVKKDKRLASR